jgi:hypothetical protein
LTALVEATVLVPDDDQLITLKGDLAGMLIAARDSKSRHIQATSWSK